MAGIQFDENSSSQGMGRVLEVEVEDEEAKDDISEL
jgi:hypothetical protein